MNVIFVAINAKFSHTNLAVRSLSSRLQASDLPSVIEEFTVNQPVREITAGIARHTPDVILFSCYLWNIELVQKVGADLRRLFPAARILLGGPEVSYNAKEKLLLFSFANGILIGEGEEIVTDAVLSSETGVVFRAQSYTDLNMLPFPYPDLPALSHRVLYYESSRGCPFGCSYCLSSADRHVRTRCLTLVFFDLKTFLDEKVMRVKFVDRTFNLDATRAYAIWKYLIAHDNGITGFQMELGGDLLTAEQLSLLKTARPGLFQFEIGVQSTCSEALEKACRKTDFSILKDAVIQIQSFGNIHCHLDLIAGLPGEGFERFLLSYDEIFALRPQQLQLGFLKLLQGSTLWNLQEDYGLTFSPYPPYEILSTPQISFAQLETVKQLEEMTEVYWNSGRFTYTLRYLLQEASPAAFFLGLAQTMPATQPGKYDYYDLLYRYGQDRPNISADLLSWFLRADLCSNERPKRIPSCLPQGRPLSRKSLSEWNLPDDSYGEWFPFDFRNPTETSTQLAFLFDYSHRDFSGRASVQVLSTDSK